MDLHVLRSLESENHIFSGLSECVYVCVIYQHNSTKNYRKKFMFSKFELHVLHVDAI